MDPSHVASAAAKQGMPAVALTDTCNLFGAVAFYKSCKGVKPIIGAELHVQPEGLSGGLDEREGAGFQVIALVEDEAGYKNLCKLITDAIVRGMAYKPRVDLAWLEAHNEGLIFLTGGRKGAFGRPLIGGDETKGRGWFAQLSAVLGPDQLFVELQDLGQEGDDKINALARELSQEHRRPLVATNAVHYEKPEDSTIHELLNAVSAGMSLNDPLRPASNTDQAYFKSEAEMRALFPNDGEAIDRTGEIAERCHFKFTLGQYHFPAATPPDADVDGVSPDTDANWAYFYCAFPPPRDYGLPDPAIEIPPRPEGSGNLNGYFEWYSARGLELRLQVIPEEKHAEYWDRLNFELKMIERMGFPAYLLIVAEFINWSKDNGIPVGPGRGSAAGSLVAYAMRITDIDPIQFELLFERFLNPERVSMPDIDVDFCQDRREEAIQHVRQKYGEPLVSQIITYGKLKAKAAVRDVARVLDLGFSDTDKISKLVPEELGITLKVALEKEEKLRVLRDGDPTIRRVLTLAMAVEGMCRQTGVHAAGVVIADRPLVEYAPLYVDEPGATPAVQFDMKSAEMIGLIKFDFLGLKTLDQIRDALEEIERNHGVKIDMSRLPTDDLPTFELLQKGDGFGVFQLESSGMRELLTKLKPSCLDDLVALVALYRPGPLKSGMVDDFVDRKHGRKQVEYPHPILEPILRSTYGTIVYQEQVMQCAQHMGGYSLGEADILRRAMGKKDAGEMARQKSRFVSGSVANGVPEEKASSIFDLLAMFAEYGFNKSHSAAYGYISYQTAWLKAHYRAEYMAALLTIDAGDSDKIMTYIEDCRHAGIRIDPVCVNASDRAFRAVPDALSEGPSESKVIRFGMAAVKGVGEGAIAAIVDARKAAGGQFKDVMDFFERIDPRKVNTTVIEHLIKAGAFDRFGIHRASVLEGWKTASTLGNRHQQEQALGQVSLFGGGASKVVLPRYKFPDRTPWTLSEQLQYEREVLGLYLTGHPMQALGKDVARYANATIGTLDQVSGDKEVRLIGIPVEFREVATRRGDKMAFVKLEDQTGMIECVFFSDPWVRSQRAVRSKEKPREATTDPVLVTGRLESGADGFKLRANTAELLADVRGRSTAEVRFNLRMTDLVGERLEQFVNLLDKRRGQNKVRVILEQPGAFKAELDLGDRAVDPGVQLEQEARALFGREVVVLA